MNKLVSAVGKVIYGFYYSLGYYFSAGYFSMENLIPTYRMSLVN